jgi:di/tricarboxylate transporter
LRMGDILLVRGSMDSLKKLRKSESFILLEGVHDEVVERHKAPVAIAMIGVIVLLAAFGIRPISVLAVAGVAVVLLTRLLSPREVYRAVDWPILVLIAGMIALGNAMEETGALDLAAGVFKQLGSYGALWALYFTTAALSLLIMNKPAAVLAAPLAIILAKELCVEPKPFKTPVASPLSEGDVTKNP